MSKKLTNKVAVVTGASKGIGAGIAKALAAEGASVVVNYSSSKEGADRVVAEITAAGGKAIAVGGSVAKAADVQRLFEETIGTYGQLDILVNNAGVFRFGPIADTTEEEYRFHYDINVLGPILVTKEALKHFGSNGGSVINISSVAGSSPFPTGLIYCSTKGALNNLTAGLALELAPRKIRVNAISPGYTETEGAQGTGLFNEEGVKHINSITPLGRVGLPSDIAPAVVFLASDDSAWITGEDIQVSGGVK